MIDEPLVDLETQQIRDAVRTARAANHRTHYSENLREDIVSYARARLKKGASQSMVAAQLGIPGSALSRFLRRSSRRFHAVQIKREPREQPSPQSVRVQTQEGLVIEGLDILGIAALIRALQ